MSSPNIRQQTIHTLQHQLQSSSTNALYQKLLIAFLLVCVVLDSITLQSTMLIFMNPIFICNGQSRTQVEACPIIEHCQIVNSFTAVYYTGLYCEKEYMRSIVQTSIFVGQMVSFLFIVPMSDSRGRKKTLVAGYGMLVLGSILEFVGIYSKIYILIIAGTFINGLFISISHVVTYVITSQFCTSKQCQFIFMIYCGMWGLAQMGFFPIYYLIPEWNNFLIVFMIVPAIGVFIISTFFLLESPMFYLCTKKDITNFNKTIEYLAVYNNIPAQKTKQLSQTAQKYLQQCQNLQQKQPSFKQSLKKLTKTKKFLIACLCLALSQSGFNVFYISMQGSMERTGFNFGISMFLAGVHELIAFVLVAFIGHRLPRKMGLVVTVFLSSLVGLTLLSPLVKDSKILQSVVISIARVLTVFSFSFFKYLETESFPSTILSTAMGVIEGLCEISTFFVPFMINSMNDIGVHPLIFASIMYLVVGLAPLPCIKQTRNSQKSQIQDITGKEQQQENYLDKQTIQQSFINYQQEQTRQSIS